MSEELPEHVRRNREAWDSFAPQYAEAGRRTWESNEPSWGVFGVPEADVGMLPESVAGLDVVELGCGTAYVSSWLARRGARPVGIDNSPAQLETARRFQQEFGVEFPLHLGNAEDTPFEDESFDFAISEYGASIWCDPYRWIPEAARILRPGGELSFLVNGTIHMLCVPDEEGIPAGDRLLRGYFGMHRFEWPDDPSVEFHLGYGDMIRLLRKSGFEVLDMIEVRPAPGTTPSHPFVTNEWAQRWPVEEGLALFLQPTLWIPPNDAGTAAAGDGKLPGTFPSLRCHLLKPDIALVLCSTVWTMPPPLDGPARSLS